jgi:hypothetical protein
MQNSDGCKKNKNACGVIDTTCTVNAVSLTPHAGTIRTALAAFKGNIYQKHICSRIVQPNH